MLTDTTFTSFEVLKGKTKQNKYLCEQEALLD